MKQPKIQLRSMAGRMVDRGIFPDGMQHSHEVISREAHIDDLEDFLRREHLALVDQDFRKKYREYIV